MNIDNYVKSIAQNFYFLAEKKENEAINKSLENIGNILIIPPHPDDECLMGALPLRISQEFKAKIHVLAFSLGSKPERKKERLNELQNACHELGFHLIGSIEDGINLKDTLKEYSPSSIFLPHGLDQHKTHIKCHYQCLEELTAYQYTGNLFFTEFWHPNLKPNLMIEISTNQVIQLAKSLLCHEGEIKRNPYHLRLPAWLMDNSRRGSEIIGGLGAEASDILFSELYEVKKMELGKINTVDLKQKIFTTNDSLLQFLT